MFFLPYARTYRATVRRKLPKGVKCGQCGFEYAYLLQAMVTGNGTSLLFLDNQGASDRALWQAEQSAQRYLERETDVVPCPSCGYIQPEMVVKARELRFSWLKRAGIFFLPIGSILLVCATATTSPNHDAGTAAVLCCAAIAAFLCVPGLPPLKYGLSRKNDPNNESVAIRKERGRRRAVAKEAFLTLRNDPQISAPRTEAGTSPKSTTVRKEIAVSSSGSSTEPKPDLVRKVCSACQTRVVPKTDGTCPACQAPMARDSALSGL